MSPMLDNSGSFESLFFVLGYSYTLPAAIQQTSLKTSIDAQVFFYMHNFRYFFYATLFLLFCSIIWGTKWFFESKIRKSRSFD